MRKNIMSTYTAIADAEIDVDSPVTQILLTKYRENMLAIQQGDASAPRIQTAAIDSAQLTAAIVAAISGIAPGGVGYTSLMIEKGLNKASRAVGDTLAGSGVTPISFRSGASASTNDTIALLDAAGSAASGTWKLGADYAFSSGENDNPIATWTRIS
jgi:hypothetical protein